jgi:hypothetical protein
LLGKVASQGGASGANRPADFEGRQAVGGHVLGLSPGQAKVIGYRLIAVQQIGFCHCVLSCVTFASRARRAGLWIGGFLPLSLGL